MITVAMAVLAGVLMGLVLGITETFGYGWSTFFGVLTFGVVQGVSGYLVQKKVKAAMTRVQAILVGGQKQLQAKVARWQMRPPSSIQAAQAEIAGGQRVFVKDTLAETEKLHHFHLSLRCIWTRVA